MKFKIKVNTDLDLVMLIRNRLKENDGYCPCALERIPDTKCMCKEFREMDCNGYCHCGLYEKIFNISEE
jgi:hypothetical protein